MSAPGFKAHQLENLEFSFLAARALEAIEKRIAGTELSETDSEAIIKASAFLRNVVEGASLVSGSDFHGHAAQVVTALRFASRPVASLQTAISNSQEFEVFFNNLAQSLDDPAANCDKLEGARDFFVMMLSSLKDALNRNGTPTVGGGYRGMGLVGSSA